MILSFDLNWFSLTYIPHAADTFYLNGGCKEFIHVRTVLWHHLWWGEIWLESHNITQNTQVDFYFINCELNWSGISLCESYISGVPKLSPTLVLVSPGAKSEGETLTRAGADKSKFEYLIGQSHDLLQCSALFLHQSLLLRAAICRLWRHNVQLDASGCVLCFACPCLHVTSSVCIWRGAHSGDATWARQSIHLSHSCLVRLHNPGCTQQFDGGTALIKMQLWSQTVAVLNEQVLIKCVKMLSSAAMFFPEGMFFVFFVKFNFTFFFVCLSQTDLLTHRLHRMATAVQVLTRLVVKRSELSAFNQTLLLMDAPVFLICLPHHPPPLFHPPLRLLLNLPPPQHAWPDSLAIFSSLFFRSLDSRCLFVTIVTLLNTGCCAQARQSKVHAVQRKIPLEFLILELKIQTFIQITFLCKFFWAPDYFIATIKRGDV